MAQFDFKKATLYIRDGSAKSGAVNNAAGYSIGATTMLVDAIVGALVNGDTFNMAGHTTIYTISAHTETLGATTSITFAPGLAAAVLDNAVIEIGPHTLTVKMGDGNFTYTEKKNREYTLDRGKLSTVRDGNEVPVELKIDAMWINIKASTGGTPTVEDVLKNRGEAATWVTSSSDACEPYAVDIRLEYVQTCGSEQIEIIDFPDFRYEDLGHDSRGGTISISGKCNVTEPTVSRVTAAA